MRRTHTYANAVKRALPGLVLVLGACSFETNDGTVASGNEALLAGKVDEAVATYTEAARQIPESAALNFDRGLAASLAGDHAGAASFLLQALGTKDKGLEQKVKSALGTAYAREALVLERTPAPADPNAPPADPNAPPAEDGAPKIPEPAMAKWKLAVEFLEDALTLDANDVEARRSLEVALLRVDPPCATRDDRFEDNDAAPAAKAIEVQAEAPPEALQSQDPSAPAPEPNKDLLKFREQMFSCPDDDDWYALELAAGDRVELAPTVPAGGGRLAFELVPPAGGGAAWTWTSPAGGAKTPPDAGTEATPRHRFVVTPETAGRWLVHAKNVDFDEVGYGLEVVVKPACNKNEDRYEDNDDRAAAKTVTPGPVPDLKLCPGDDDWFAVTLAEGESLFLFAQPTDKPAEDAPKPPEGAPPAPPPFQVEVLDEAGNVRARGAPIDTSLVSTLLMPGAGRYLVHVLDQPGDPTPFEGRYALQVEVVPPCPEGDDRFEDNDDALSPTDFMEASQPPPAQGQPPKPQQGPPVVFARVCPGDQDWWKVTSDGTKPALVSAVFDHAQGDLWLELFDESAATSLASSDTSSAAQNGEVVALPMADKPVAAAPGAGPAPDPNAPPEPPPAPKTYLVRVQAKHDAQNFYLLRLDNPSGGGGDSQDDSKDDSQEGDPKDPSDPKDGEDEKDEAEPKDPKQNPLQDALDNLDRNPENLPARDAARKSPLANQKPLKDW